MRTQRQAAAPAPSSVAEHVWDSVNGLWTRLKAIGAGGHMDEVMELLEDGVDVDDIFELLELAENGPGGAAKARTTALRALRHARLRAIRAGAEDPDAVDPEVIVQRMEEQFGPLLDKVFERFVAAVDRLERKPAAPTAPAQG